MREFAGLGAKGEWSAFPHVYVIATWPNLLPHPSPHKIRWWESGVASSNFIKLIAILSGPHFPTKPFSAVFIQAPDTYLSTCWPSFASIVESIYQAFSWISQILMMANILISELIDEIFKYLDTCDIYICLFVSHQFHEHAIRFIYRTISLEAGSNPLNSLSEKNKVLNPLSPH